MANIPFIIYFFLIISSFIKCDRLNCEKVVSPTDKYDCFDSIDEDDKEDGYHCCYRKNTRSSGNINYECDLIEKDDYEDIDYYKEEESITYGLSDISIECENQSNIQIYKYKYLIFTLLNLII